MDDGLHDAVTIVVNETQRPTLVRYCQSKLIVVNQADLQTKLTCVIHSETGFFSNDASNFIQYIYIKQAGTSRNKTIIIETILLLHDDNSNNNVKS